MSEIQKPFARWGSFQECVDEMMTTQHHDKESAGAICHTIEERASKGMLYKADETLEITKSSTGKMIVVGPATWEIADPENDYNTVDAQIKFLKKFFEMPEAYRNISIDHQSLIMGKAVQKAVGADGRTHYSHVHEKGTVLVSEIRSDTNLAWVNRYREEIAAGVYKMYSIRASNAIREPAIVEGRKVNKILDMDPIEVAIVKQGMCPKAGPLEIVAKTAKAGLVKTLDDLSKMTWEECIAQASADPKVDNPEALCGWLKANGPGPGKSAEAVPISKTGTIEERIGQVLGDYDSQLKNKQNEQKTTVSVPVDLQITATQIFNKHFSSNHEEKKQ